jgi:hypothetical protein
MSCSLMDKMEWVFSDADLVPLLVQENYANYMPDLARNASRPDMVSSPLVLPPHACQHACMACDHKTV